MFGIESHGAVGILNACKCFDKTLLEIFTQERVQDWIYSRVDVRQAVAEDVREDLIGRVPCSRFAEDERQL
jgi:hypothetical protein